MDKIAGECFATVEINGRGERFEDVGQEGGRNAGISRHTFAENQKIAEAELIANFGAGAAADDDRFDFGQIAFEIIGKQME